MESVTPAHPSPIELLQLLAEPVRWQILQELALSDRRVHELTELTGRPQNLVSYHLRELREAGLVSARRSSADGRDSYYRVDLADCVRALSETAAAFHPGLRLAPVAPPRPAGRTGRRPRVLFLCTGNSARSQMAQALTEHLSDHTVDARSAGSHPKALHPDAVRIMADRGLDISDRTPTHLRRFTRLHFDHVVTLCDKVREVCPEFPRDPDRIHWSIADPASAAAPGEASVLAFERTAREIEERVGFFLARLTDPVHHEEPTHA